MYAKCLPSPSLIPTNTEMARTVQVTYDIVVFSREPNGVLFASQPSDQRKGASLLVPLGELTMDSTTNKSSQPGHFVTQKRTYRRA